MSLMWGMSLMWEGYTINVGEGHGINVGEVCSTKALLIY